MQGPCKTRLSEKQLLKVPLFRSVKQINGERIFRSLCENCWALSYETRYSDKQLSLKQNFIYVKQGQVLVYKMVNGSTTKSLIKSYRSEQYCGFQDYPLFWGEDFFFDVNCKTTLLIVPLEGHPDDVLKLQGRIFEKAEFIQRNLTLENIQIGMSQSKISSTKEGDKIENIIVIYSGKLQLKSKVISETIVCGQNQDFLAKEVKQNIEICCFTVKCTQQADILAIPKQQFKKIIDIRYHLNEIGHKQLQNNNRQQTIGDDNKSQKSLSSLHSRGRNAKSFSKSFYPKQTNESFDHSVNFRLKSANKRLMTQKPVQSEAETSKYFTPSNYSLGEIQLLKFIRRKQKIENRNFFKYIQSRAPQIVLNPSKQFALIKPLYKSGSLYVKNMKRRIKNSMSSSQTSNSTTNYIDLTL